ncbi:MAG: PAS domain-containing sensor histidine kinase, partial [Candidatus Thorarchaeota archaeon]|nr:PAS domain-containing sensor histidine kinase [Candidatus Thorarchaeota archaeon]
MEDYRLLVSVIDGTNDLVVSVLPNRSFEFVNRAWLDTLEYDEPEVDNLTLVDIVFPESIQAFDEAISDVLAGSFKSGVELTFLTKAGNRVDVEGNLFPRKEGNKTMAATGFFRDVTERNAIRGELMKANSLAEFITDLMIHDLANINQEILSLLEILLYDSILPQNLSSLVQGGLMEIEKASRITTIVRGLSGMDETPPELQDWDLDKVVKDAANRVDMMFNDRKVKLKTNFSAGQYTLRADTYFPDIFFGLMHNSVKVDKHGAIPIEVNAESLPHTRFLRIKVIDHGPGIPDAQKESIFGKVHRRERLLGTGIGLSLVKALVGSYGGYLSVEDTVTGD